MRRGAVKLGGDRARRGAIPLVLLLALCAFGGCERKPEGTDASPAAPVTLRVANWAGAHVESEFARLERSFQEEFEADHPGVTVRVEQIPGHGQYAPKLLMMHVAGSIPDVIQLDASSSAVFIDNGVLRDLTPYIERDPAFDLDNYFANVAKILRRGDALFGIPLDFTPMVMYYNRALFDAAGVAYPEPGWTWDDFLEKARALTIRTDPEAPPTQYAMHFENVMAFWLMWLWTGGGDVLGPDGRRASGTLDGPETVAAVQFLLDLIFQHRVAPTPREAAAAGADLFRTGRAAMDVKGHWMLIDYRADGLDVGVVGLPRKAGVARTTVIYASGLAISSKARHPDLAWEYIKHMTSERVQTRRVAPGLAISGNRATAAHYAQEPLERVFLAEVEYARRPWGSVVERYPFIEELGRTMMEDLLLSGGEGDVRATLSRTAELIDRSLGPPGTGRED